MSPERVSKEYEAGLRFNQGIDLYDCVRTNENFFIGKQWEGVQANGLPTPVFNFLKRVVLFSVANVSTDNLKLHAKPMPSSGERPAAEVEQLTDILNDQFTSIFEFNKMGACIREFCRNAAVDGDGCLYAWWDPDQETGQEAKGGIRVEVLPNTQVIFGNPNSRELQTQPYILIEKRMLLEDARDLMTGGDRDLITPDDKESGDPSLDQLGGEKVTVITRLWRSRQTGTIHAYQCTRQAELRGEWDLELRHYPLTWMSWDFIQDCYHGQAMITGLIPNQIFVNKLFAMTAFTPPRSQQISRCAPHPRCHPHLRGRICPSPWPGKTRSSAAAPGLSSTKAPFPQRRRTAWTRERRGMSWDCPNSRGGPSPPMPTACGSQPPETRSPLWRRTARMEGGPGRARPCPGIWNARRPPTQTACGY